MDTTRSLVRAYAYWSACRRRFVVRWTKDEKNDRGFEAQLEFASSTKKIEHFLDSRTNPIILHLAGTYYVTITYVEHVVGYTHVSRTYTANSNIK